MFRGKQEKKWKTWEKDHMLSKKIKEVWKTSQIEHGEMKALIINIQSYTNQLKPQIR